MPEQVDYEEREDVKKEEPKEEEVVEQEVAEEPSVFLADDTEDPLGEVGNRGDEDPEDEDAYWDSRKADPEMVVFTDGPKVKQVNKWKDEFGEDNIYTLSVTPTVHIVWRALRRGEYRAMVRQFESMLADGVSEGEANIYQEDMIARKCILHPDHETLEEKNTLAGVAASVSSAVMEASGFSILDVRQL